MINKLGLKAKDQGLAYMTKSCMTLAKDLKNIKQTFNLPLKCVTKPIPQMVKELIGILFVSVLYTMKLCSS